MSCRALPSFDKPNSLQKYCCSALPPLSTYSDESQLFSANEFLVRGQWYVYCNSIYIIIST